MASKFPWRRVETGSTNKLEFIYGGNKERTWSGLACLVFSLFVLLFICWHSRAFFDFFSSSLQLRDYGALSNFYGLLAFWILSSLAMVGGSLWLFLGRTRITIDGPVGTLSKTRSLSSFTFWQKTYELGNLSAVSFGRAVWLRRFYPGHWDKFSTFLRQKDGKARTLLVVPEKHKDKGRAMAEQIARFADLPCEIDPAFRN